MTDVDRRGFIARINQRLKALGLTRRSASLQAGLSDTAIRDLTANSEQSPKLSTIEAIAFVLECDPAWLAFGTGPDPLGFEDDAPPKPELQPVSNLRGFGLAPVAGLVQAGNWVEVDLYGVETAELVSAPRDPDFPYARQVAYRVGGDSQNKAEPRPIQEGDIIICVAFEDTGLQPTTGMKVVVERTRYDGALRERSVKDLVVFEDRTEFHPRSSNPVHKPIVVPKDHDPDDTTVVEIIALVRYTFNNVPMPITAGG